VLADEGVRILAVGQEEEADRLVVRRERQAHFQRPPGGLAAGGVAVEAEHQLVGEAQELGNVHRRSAPRALRIGNITRSRKRS
jgi:hypothetical protein